MAYTAYIACFVSVIVARVSAFTVADCPANIPHDNTLRVHGNFCYTFDTHHSNTYPAAERGCESRGGHLVTVRDADTQAFLATTLLNEFRYRGIVWIGFTDAKVEGHWEWVDGTPAHYTHWASGQPGIAGGFEDCAGMDLSKSTTGEWEDFMCEGFLFLSQEHRFVCEYQIPSTVTAKPATTAPPATTKPPVTTTPLPTTAGPTVTVPVDTTAQPLSVTPGGDTTTTTPMPTTGTTAEPVPTTTMEAHTSHPHSTHVSRANGHAATTACPAFTCGLDCGLGGYQIDANGCMQCVCQA